MPVPSGKSISEYRRCILELSDRRTELELEIQCYTDVLTRNRVGMRDSLTDADDFPRADVDVYEVRRARNRIIYLQNDHKAIMKRIEEAMHEMHAMMTGGALEDRDDAEESLDEEMPPSHPATGSSTSNNGHHHHANGDAGPATSNGGHSGDNVPIAWVNLVDEGSPAEDAGIQLGDEIVEFGSVNATNMKGTEQIAEVVQSCLNRDVVVKIKRDGAVMTLSLKPRVWRGRGYLGCNIIPINHDF